MKNYQATNTTKLKHVSPKEDHGLSKQECKERLATATAKLQKLQGMFYAQNKHAVLVVFQAMDAAGKDGAIKHVMSGLNPQGCEVTSFKQPSTAELQHQYLWRIQQKLPERGRIGIFNRSHYEEVLITKVHPNLLAAQGISEPPKNIWEQRYSEIRNFETTLANNGTVILKFFLHISKEEQRERFLARLEDPNKNWKFSTSDLKERNYWEQYQSAYQDAIQATTTAEAPWYIIPANKKWFARMVIAETLVKTLEALNPTYPTTSKDRRQELQLIQKQLEAGQ